MTSLTELIQHGGSLWVFFPSALVLGALHGLEPGHSKTMMAAFIISIRGTVTQAILLGLSATFSHTLIVWLVAGIGLMYGRNWYSEANEAYFQLASGVIIFLIAFWMFRRIYKERLDRRKPHGDPGAPGPHGGRLIDTGHGTVEVSVFETDVPPHFRLHWLDVKSQTLPPQDPETVSLRTLRARNETQDFVFQKQGDFLQSTTEIPEPHEFKLELQIRHGDHAHRFETEFIEAHDHGNGHSHAGMHPEDPDFHDAHQRAHAEEISQRFANREATTWQIIVFGLTGGLIPCPSAITVLILCLQIKRVALGFFLVLGFGVGLAVTMVASGVLAALGFRHASKRWGRLSELFQYAPYLASACVMVLSVFICAHALMKIRG